MTPKLNKSLFDAFPLLYRDRNAPNTKSLMMYAFECRDGWYDLLYVLSLQLEKEILKEPKNERKNFRASQVKQKYGTLRFYMTQSTIEMERLIEEATNVSAHVCELCGAPGVMKKDTGWLMVKCDGCANK